jgi:elongation factor 1 alpha-like protein
MTRWVVGAQERYEEIKAALTPFLRQCGFPNSALQWLPVAGPTGQNITRAPTEPALAAWWKGPTLLQAIDAFKPPPRQTAHPLRIPVSDVVGPSRGGVVVAGKLEAGTVQVQFPSPRFPHVNALDPIKAPVDGHSLSL